MLLGRGNMETNLREKALFEMLRQAEPQLREKFSRAHGAASNGLNRPLNRSIGKMLARVSEKKGRALEIAAEYAEKNKTC